MSALGFLAASSMLAGGLPPLWGRRKAPRMPDPVAQDRAAAKRARKAAKRAEDARRTAEGRTRVLAWSYPPLGFWDWWEEAERLWRDPHPPIPVPAWQVRLNHRRSLPWVGPHWAEVDGAQWRRAELQTRRMNRRMRRGAR